MESKNIQIAIVDDDQLVVQLLASFLQKKDAINILLTANSGNQFLENLEKTKEKPDVVLLDLRMRDGNGLETIDELIKRYSNLKIAVLSSYYKSSSIGYMLKLGVHAFLPKGIDKEELVDVIDEVYKKGHYFTDNQVDFLRNQISHKTPKQYIKSKEELTTRELEVLQLICQQYTAKEIGEKLFVTTKNIEFHKSNLLIKTGVKNTAGLIIYAIQNKVVNVNDVVLLN